MSSGAIPGRLGASLVGLLFFAGPPAIVGVAVSLRTTGQVDARHVVVERLLLHADAARRAADEAGLPLDFVLAVASVESAGRPGARSGAGAVGLMQLMPATAAELAADLGVPDPDLCDPAVSLRLGAHYLRRQVDRFGGRPAGLELALCAYNAGPGAVDRWLREDPLPADAASLGSWVPYRETRGFVRKVREWQEIWSLRLPAPGGS